MLGRFFLLSLLSILPDSYIFLRYVWKRCQWRTQVLYIVFALLCIVLMVSMFSIYVSSESALTQFQASMVMSVLFIVFIAKLFFSIVDVWTIFGSSMLLKKTAFGLAALGILTTSYGILFGRFNMSAKYATVECDSLPESFDGYKILQISDFHLVSLQGSEGKVSEWIDSMNAKNPDLICFTGDFASSIADEMTSYIEILKRLEAKDGKLAILGNHDYGDYHNWANQAKRDSNLAQLQVFVRRAGFEVLNNANRTVCRNGDSISVVGTENWGKSPFPQYSDLKKAERGALASTRILLTHDPDFWEYQLDGNNDYFLTLSGHTHAMQFGLEIGDWEVSPSVLRYPYWHGLYEKDGRQIFVTRGIGCTGLFFRIGMSPEYVVVTLKKKR